MSQIRFLLLIGMLFFSASLYALPETEAGVDTQTLQHLEEQLKAVQNKIHQVKHEIKEISQEIQQADEVVIEDTPQLSRHTTKQPPSHTSSSSVQEKNHDRLGGAKVHISIDLSQQRMRVYRGGKLLYKWRVSTARRGYVTPTGTYRPLSLERMHRSKLYHNSPMPYSIFFRGNYAIHGTYSTRRLGRRASHGCVRLHPSHARKLFALVRRFGKSNTLIKIHY